jgi:hypothetical protein
MFKGPGGIPVDSEVKEMATTVEGQPKSAKNPTRIWGTIAVFAIVIELLLLVAVLSEMIEFGEMVDYSFTFLLAIATIMLAWFTRMLASVNERLQLIEESRDRKDHLRVQYDRLKEKIQVAETILRECRVAPVEGLSGPGSPPQPEANLMHSLSLLIDPRNDGVPLEQLHRVNEIFATVRQAKRSDPTLAGTIIRPYMDVTEALVSELPRWRKQIVELIPKLYS